MLWARGRGTYEILAIVTVAAVYIFLTVPLLQAAGQVGC